MDEYSKIVYGGDDIKEPEKIDLNISYPYDPDYEYHTRLVRLHLDKEREKDIMSDKGFIVAPTQGVKKDVKNPFSIFSSKFGQTIKDVNPFGNRYKCECGYTQNKVNNGCICKICGTKVKYVDDNYEYFGWLVLQDYWIISPAFYNALRFFIGKDFDSIIKYDAIVDEDGHQREVVKPKNQPYYGIGIITFRDKFDDIMNYYLSKNKKKEKYDDIMSQREKVFTQSIPVFTVLLRPFDVDRYTFSHETTNKDYTIINKLVSSINKESAIEKKATHKNKDEPIRKSTQDLLWKLQIKLDVLCSEVIEIIKGKKGNIRALFGGRYNFTSRNVITADPSLRIDEVRLPYSALLELLQQSIINILTKTHNLSYSDAYKRWYEANLKKDPMIVKIIESIIYNAVQDHRGLPVIINRNPTINYGSILQMFCVGLSDTLDKFEYVMQVPLQVLPLLAADFDGDVLNLLYIINRAFYERAYEIFNPRNAFYISRNDGLFNNLVNHQKDTLINANTLIELGRHVYTAEDLANIQRIKAKWNQ